MVGDGKLGDFYGVISVDCRAPEASRWIFTGGYLFPERVPSEAVNEIRKLACPL